jgi:hypothetical protein
MALKGSPMITFERRFLLRSILLTRQRSLNPFDCPGGCLANDLFRIVQGMPEGRQRRRVAVVAQDNRGVSQESSACATVLYLETVCGIRPPTDAATRSDRALRARLPGAHAGSRATGPSERPEACFAQRCLPFFLAWMLFPVVVC